MDLPEDPVSYVHRIGRTGRLREGTATSFFDPLSDLDIAPELARVRLLLIQSTKPPININILDHQRDGPGSAAVHSRCCRWKTN